MIKTTLIVLGIVAVIEICNFISGFGKRKMVSYTIMTMVNDLAELSKKSGYKSWIEYYNSTYGREEALVFLNQLYTTLEKNKIFDERIDKVRSMLKEYLVEENKKVKKKD